MRQVAEHFGYPVNRSGFILSPFRKEKTASCKLYRNSYYDFSAAVGGDLIKFTASILNINNWEACQYLIQAFSLPISLSDGIDRREEIERRQRERQRQEGRQQAFRAALLGEIDSLKRWADIYRAALEKQLYEPFCEMWGYCINELQKAEHKLDILCTMDQDTYRRMKPYAAAGLSSDCPQWFIDALAILAKDGAFQATKKELARIEKQRDFELRRQPGEGRQQKRGEVRRRRERENLQKMSDSDLIMLLENLIGVI